jgi:hypothetical protein
MHTQTRRRALWDPHKSGMSTQSAPGGIAALIALVIIGLRGVSRSASPSPRIMVHCCGESDTHSWKAGVCVQQRRSKRQSQITVTFKIQRCIFQPLARTGGCDNRVLHWFPLQRVAASTTGRLARQCTTYPHTHVCGRLHAERSRHDINPNLLKREMSGLAKRCPKVEGRADKRHPLTCGIGVRVCCMTKETTGRDRKTRGVCTRCMESVHIPAM